MKDEEKINILEKTKNENQREEVEVLKKYNRLKIITFIIGFLCSFFMSMPLMSLASNIEDTANLTLNYIHSDIEFSVYRVAEESESGYVLTSDFSEYPVSIDAKTSEEWKALSYTLATYVEADNIPETVSDKTYNNTVTFKNLKTGMYLVLGKAYTIDGYYYTLIPFLVVLTDGDDITVDPKYDKYGSIIDEENYEDYFVRKIWVDSENSDNRPQNITLHLLKEGTVYDTITLNESNQWEYTWKDLNTKYHWSVIEENVPKSYTVSITQEGTSFIVTNTFRKEETITGSDSANLQTGDDANIWPYVGILVIGVLLVVYLILTRKKKNFEDR